MADFRFTKGDYRNLCDAIRSNDIARFQSIVDAVSDEDRSRFGPTTFCPPPSTKLQSPLVTAAQFSELCCKHLVKVFPNAIDINANGLVYGTILSAYTTTALVAACTATSGMFRNELLDIGLIKYLVENGADVNQATLDGGTPLMAAALHVPYSRNQVFKVEFWNLFQYFVSKGADVNKTDRHGNNCLLFPICMYGTSVIKYLHSAGVNIDLEHRNAQGYTILHEACRRGMATEYIRNALQCVPLPLYAPSTDSTHPGYIPCPLYLAAAAKGNEADLEELLKIEDFPLEGVADAYLLCGAVKPHGKSALSKGLALLEKHSIQLSYPPPRPEYDYQMEIKTTKELDAVWGNEDHRSMVYQRALIMERCLGPNSLQFAEFLLDLARNLIRDKHFTEMERFLEKSINISMDSSYHPLRSLSGYCYEMSSMSKCRRQVTLLIMAVERMLKNNYIPNFPCFVAYMLYISDHYSHFNILDLFRRWKVCNTHQGKFVTFFRSFVNGYAQLSTGSTVLHEILKQKRLPYKQISGLPVEQLQETFIEAALEAGCDEFVNCVDDNGQRPLHILANNIRLAKLLIDHGAHVDAVDSQGKPALPMGTFGVPSLYCTVANAIVQYSLPYQSIGLPPHVVQFVMLHDPLCAII